jgi:formate C-acetyltransferase
VDDCFLDGPIARARSWTLGGTPYTNLVCALTSPATAADCFAALEELVFRSQRVPLETLQDALREDFAGYEALRQRCLHAPKFGQDDPRADAHAVRLLELVSREIDAASRRGTPDAIPVFRCTETDMRHLHFGRETGATPDGRRAGQPTSENTSPTPGSCTRGLTALFRSLARLPFYRIHSGALNVRLPPRLVAGEEGLARLAALLRTYFEAGGLQVQLSLADTAQLRAAQAQPEAYRDLMVRITGYSAAFVDMSRAAQEEIIRREENAEIGT